MHGVNATGGNLLIGCNKVAIMYLIQAYLRGLHRINIFVIIHYFASSSIRTRAQPSSIDNTFGSGSKILVWL